MVGNNENREKESCPRTKKHECAKQCCRTEEPSVVAQPSEEIACKVDFGKNERDQDEIRNFFILMPAQQNVIQYKETGKKRNCVREKNWHRGVDVYKHTRARK